MSSSSGKPNQEPGLDSMTDRFRDSFSFHADKPDCKELNFRSPVSPLNTRQSGSTTGFPTTSSSSSSSGSVSGRNVGVSAQKRSGNSEELSVSMSDRLTRNFRPGHRRSDSTGSVQHLMSSGSSSANSPVMNVLPTGNICPSGRIVTSSMTPTRSSLRRDVLGSGTGNYGHGSIMRGGVSKLTTGDTTCSNLKMNVTGERGLATFESEEMKMAGNEHYKKGNFLEALHCYDKAIALSPGNAALRSNKAAALSGLGRLVEAVRESEEAMKLDPGYTRAYHRLSSLFIRLGLVEHARRHFSTQKHKPNVIDLEKLQILDRHLNKCTDARKAGDWAHVLGESDAAISAGADSSPQLFACRAEALLKLEQLEDGDRCLSNVPKFNLSIETSSSRFFGMVGDAYFFFVRAEIDMALGRFESAIASVEKAAKIDPLNSEISTLFNNVKLVARARSRGNDLFNSERFTEASAAYGEGLRLHPSNPVLYCNRAACWHKLGLWERSVEDCNHALRILPNYTKCLLRRAASNTKLERWSEAVRDYEILRRELPEDKEIAESLFHAQVALKKSRGEEVYNMKFGGDVEEILNLEQLRAAISSQGISVVHFKAASNIQCKEIAPFFDSLCSRYPSINFLKVDVEESPAVAESESVRIVPTFKIYKNGSRLKEMICPNRQVLEYSVRHYSL